MTSADVTSVDGSGGWAQPPERTQPLEPRGATEAAGDAQFALALIRRSLGNKAAAAQAYRAAIRLGTSRMAESYAGLGVTLLEMGHASDALAACLRAIQLRPGFAEAFLYLGRAAAKLGDARRAVAALERAIALDGNQTGVEAKAQHELGRVYFSNGELERSRAALLRAIELDPPKAGPSRYLLAIVLSLLGEPEGLALSRELVRERPRSAHDHFQLGVALLLHGEYEQGWRELEWRMLIASMRPNHPQFAQPRWRGEALEGRPILVYSEQGFGDTLQFARYLPLVASRGGRVILEVEHHLERLMRTMPGVSECLVRGRPRPDFSVWAPLMSLPLIFSTTYETIPPPAAPRLPSAATRPPHGAGLQVGLVWGGSPKHERDRLRSIPLAELEPLSRVAGVSFTSLQRGPAMRQIEPAGRCFGFVEDDEVRDFADTAALIAQLDLVITVDTSVAHLAGTMGKPVWILLANMPDWRWGLRGFETGWYPSARLFRQSAPGDWAPVIEQVTCALRELAGTRHEPV